VIELEELPCPVPVECRLRALLKAALRAWRFRARSAKELKP
jgi:hypothetical protein